VRPVVTAPTVGSLEEGSLPVPSKNVLLQDGKFAPASNYSPRAPMSAFFGDIRTGPGTPALFPSCRRARTALQPRCSRNSHSPGATSARAEPRLECCRGLREWCQAHVSGRIPEGLLCGSFFKSPHHVTAACRLLCRCVSWTVVWGLVSRMFSDECVRLSLHAPATPKPMCAPWVALGLAGPRCFPVPSPPRPASHKAHCVSIPCACRAMHALATR